MLAGGANQSFHHFSRPATDMARPFLLLVGLFALRAALALPIVEFTSGTKLGDLPRATLLAPKGLVRRADIALTAVEFKASGKRGGRGGRHIITTMVRGRSVVSTRAAQPVWATHAREALATTVLLLSARRRRGLLTAPALRDHFLSSDPFLPVPK